MSLPFEGAISSFYENDAPKNVRQAVSNAGKGPILDGSFPYTERIDKHDYEDQLHALKIELLPVIPSQKPTSRSTSFCATAAAWIAPVDVPAAISKSTP